MPRGEVQTTIEAEELSAAKAYGIIPLAWDELPIEERLRLMGAARDTSTLEYISALPDDERRQMRGASEWVIVGDKDGR